MTALDVPERPVTDAPALVPAGWWSRVGASIVDSLVVAVGALILAIPALIEGMPVVIAAISGVLAGAFYLGYAPVLLARSGGQTVGRSAVGIKVINDDGTPIGLGRAFLREDVVKLVFGLLTLPWLISIVWPAFDDRRRTLHDLVVSTRVVRATADVLAVQGPEPTHAQDSSWDDEDVDPAELDPITRRALEKQGRLRPHR
jgi:uncharacterized RDD family membrane protein YckC